MVLFRNRILSWCPFLANRIPNFGISLCLAVGVIVNVTCLILMPCCIPYFLLRKKFPFKQYNCVSFYLCGFYFTFVDFPPWDSNSKVCDMLYEWGLLSTIERRAKNGQRYVTTFVIKAVVCIGFRFMMTHFMYVECCLQPLFQQIAQKH